MINTYFWKDILNKGAILGVFMTVSAIFEQCTIIYGGTISWMSAMGFEYVVSIVVYVWLIYRFAKHFSLQVMDMQKDIKTFSYAQGFLYVIMLSILTGVVVGLGTYIFRHFVVGYTEYVEATIRAMQNALKESQLPSSVTSSYKQLFSQMASQVEPTIFSVLRSSCWNYMFTGTLLGLVIAGIVKREPQLFNSDNDAE
ncbi:MAG: DUF4199 domain-containing protein [Alistipes sp.]|nr:DUF4199 domain-containing protein [Alistipes sp.]